MSEIFTKLRNAENKGDLLEKILKDILETDNFENIRIQKKGSQFGFDLLANKNLEKWKFECKNLKNTLTVNDFAPKIIWHINSNIDKFVFVTISDISNDLLQLLETIKFPFYIEIWNYEFLKSKILKSKKALKRLDLNKLYRNTKTQITPHIFEPKQVNFNIIHHHNPPFSYDYFYTDDGNINKSYTENSFKLLSIIKNETKEVLKINSLIVKTLKYKIINTRVLREHKSKGLFKLENLKFIPSTQIGDEIELMKDNEIFITSPNSEELILFELSKEAKQGYYELLFISKGFLKDKPITFYSKVFPLHIKGGANNFLQLNVVGKHYDSPVSTLLDLSNNKWNELRRLTWDKKKQVYLGNTVNDIINRKNSLNWEIKTVKIKKKKKKEAVLSNNSKVYMDLGIPITEKMHNISDSLKNVLNIE